MSTPEPEHITLSGARLTNGPARSVPTLTEVLKLRLGEGSAGTGLEATLAGGSVVGADAAAFPGVTVAHPELDLNLDDMSGFGTTMMMPDGSLVEALAPSRADGGAALDGQAQAESQSQITERVLGQVQRHVDLMLEYRLRETLTPALARMTDAFIRDTRNELAATLREIVARAVDAELNRSRR
jgi:hypothetical protein